MPNRILTWAVDGKPVPIKDEWFSRFRKKPVAVRAFRAPQPIIVHTLEGDMRAEKGDFIIEGVQGELYPCKPSIFWKTYEQL